MTWKRPLYIVFVAVIAGVSALTGAVAGGLAVYRAVGQKQPSLSIPVPSSSNSNTSSTPSQALVLNSPDIAAAYNLPAKWGVYVQKVVAGSPASTAGLQADDIITSLNGVQMDETHDYLNMLYAYKPGDQVSLGLMRDGKELTLDITLGESSHT